MTELELDEARTRAALAHQKIVQQATEFLADFEGIQSKLLRKNNKFQSRKSEARQPLKPSFNDCDHFCSSEKRLWCDSYRHIRVLPS